MMYDMKLYLDGLVQDCSNSSVLVIYRYLQQLSGSQPFRDDRVSEWVIKFNGLSRTMDIKVHVIHISPCKHSLYIGIIIFPRIDNTQSTGYN